MNFFKSFLASCLGATVALAVVFLLVFSFFTALISASGDTQVTVEENSVLHLKLETPITELEFEDPLAEIIPGASDQSHGLLQIIDAIKHAKDDANIKGIFLNTSSLQTGFASLQELREAIVDFKTSGKWVVSYADNYTEGAYYLASVADKVYLSPEGDVEFNGLAIEVSFFKKLFDKLDIRPEIFRVGDFKSAVEPFMRENLSPENKLQLNSILTSIYGEILKGVSDSRNIPYDKLKEISDKMLVRNAAQAQSLGLIDSLFYDDQIKDLLRGRLGLEKNKKISLITYHKYKKSYPALGNSKNEIAVIVAEGDILPGKAEQGVVGSTTIMNEIRRARNDDRVKAIIIRINSPGGAAQAADNMWREITLASKQKPVIASMSDYAASGGYYLAMGCDTIVARPTTITGSIGVFSVLFDLSNFLDDKIGITSEEVKTGEVGELVTVTRPLTDLEKNIWQTRTNEIYETFTRKAADGRHMQQDDIKKIASGRVWTGSQAKENGLSDLNEGFKDAVRIAAERSGVGNDFRLRYYPQPKPLLERLTSDWEDDSKTKALKAELGEYYRWYKQWSRIRNYAGTQARMSVEFEVR